MIQKKRLDIIMDILKKKGMADIKTLSRELDVTEKTVRLDLKELEQQNFVERVHGGAVLKVKTIELGGEDSLRRISHPEQKRAIAERILSRIQENDVILLDDGSTTQELGREMIVCSV